MHLNIKCEVLKYIYTFLVLVISLKVNGQQINVVGTVLDRDGAVAFATVYIAELNKVTSTDRTGSFTFDDVPEGQYSLEVSLIGYKTFSKGINVSQELGQIEVKLEKELLLIDEVVVTGTKTFKRKTNSPVVVNVIDSKNLSNVQACNLSEGLKFQTGLRVETDCQTCNYSQLRMNGLAGGYSQILVNGRPIFSPLTSLYGLEQLPVNMIDRIEVVRGGGSSLYGSSAIGGTVNVITKIPTESNGALSYTMQDIGGEKDHQFTANTTILNADKTLGASFFLNARNRSAYDHNNDNFSELPELTNKSFGMNMMFKPSSNQKLEWSISNLNEYRYGGELSDKTAHLTLQSEERNHDIWMTSLDYQRNFAEGKGSFIFYGAGQYTDRTHYTGIFPDDSMEINVHLSNPPYGQSTSVTGQGGVQLNYEYSNFGLGKNIWTLGSEYIVDDIEDEIQAYNYLVDQTTRNLGVFVQSDWMVNSNVTLLSGLRMDHHNLVDRLILSPRLSLMYKWRQFLQWRMSFATGFRAPQAFDTDLHIAFAGGGISRVQLDDDLSEERSKSWSTSINYDFPSEHYIVGFTVEGFYTELDDAFYLDPVGEDEFGEVFVKKNGAGAIVKGLSLEGRANYDKRVQLELGVTYQRSEFKEEVEYIDELPGTKSFIRTPDWYGFAMLSITPNDSWYGNLNYVYTGEMLVPHFAGAPNQLKDEMISTESFSELDVKCGYLIDVQKWGLEVDLYAGVKNVLDAYQPRFDIGKNRDSNFVYGPAAPRTFFVGTKVSF